MPSLASFGDNVPVNGVDVAERRVLLESHGSAQNIGQGVETDFLQVHHLECHEGVIDKERITADNRQIRKQMADGPQSAYSGNTSEQMRGYSTRVIIAQITVR